MSQWFRCGGPCKVAEDHGQLQDFVLLGQKVGYPYVGATAVCLHGFFAQSRQGIIREES